MPAVLKALTVRKYCVFPAKPLTVTEVWFQGTLTFPMVSGLVSSSQYTTCLRQRSCHLGFNRDIWILSKMYTSLACIFYHIKQNEVFVVIFDVLREMCPSRIFD